MSLYNYLICRQIRILNPKKQQTVMKTLKIFAYVLAAALLMAAAPFTFNSEKEANSYNDDIVTLASETEALSTLAAAIEAAGLAETLQNGGPFTVFAPTNEAFEALPEGTLESLLMPENRELLVQILTYHVVPGEVMSGDLEDGMRAETVEGSEVTISVNNYGASVDGASVVQADIEASNGVIHVIDSVIIPGAEQSGGSY
jgi:uncharacterized surface protein with fasciclin (FAS1) repeats